MSDKDEIVPAHVLTELKSLRRELGQSLTELKEQVQKIVEVLHGGHGRLGLIARVQVIWSMWVWVLATFATGLGSFVTWLILRNPD